MTSAFPESIALGRRPTPVEHLPELSRIFEGPEIYIKRDDLTGVGLSGNKVRKLEFLLAEAREQNCDCVITCGGAQSNHARTTAVAAAKVGLGCHLVLRDAAQARIDGNLFINHLVGAEVHNVTADEYEQVEEVMHALATKLSGDGHCPYVIPEGGSNETGALGYMLAVKELSEQLRERNLRLDHIVVPVGSGGTLAGLLLGKYLFDLPATIYGINVCDDKAYFVRVVGKLLKATVRKFDLQIDVPRSAIRIIDGYVGKGYGLCGQEEIDIIKLVAMREGLILDPVYTGKAMLGLSEQIREGTFRASETVLFWHTGGIFGLFPKRGLFF